MYKFNGKLIYSYKTQVCEDMLIRPYNYIKMIVDLKEGIVKFEKGQEIFVVAQLKMFRAANKIRPFIQISEQQNIY